MIDDNKLDKDNILTQLNNCYRNNDKALKLGDSASLNRADLVLYRVKSITFKKDAPKKEALENVLSSLRIEGINFIYLILGDKDGVEFYYGISRDYSKPQPELDIDDIGKFILEPSILGNFRGSKIERIDKNEKQNILDRIKSNNENSMIEGVPGVVENEDEFQGVDRLADTMMSMSEGVDSGKFGFMVIASLINDDEVDLLKEQIFTAYNGLAHFSKMSLQTQKGENSGTSKSDTKGSNTSVSSSINSSENRNESTTQGESVAKATNTAWSEGTQTSKGTSSNSGSSSSSHSTNNSATQTSSKSGGDSETKTTNGSKSQSITKSKGETKSESKGESSSITTGENSGSSSSKSETREVINKLFADWQTYINDILLPRIDYGSGNGLFASGMFCFADSKAVLKKLENTIISLFSGDKGNKIPLKAFRLNDKKRLESLRNFQLPKVESSSREISAVFSQAPKNIANVISAKELSLIAGLPKKDVLGLELREEVEFGLNLPSNIEHKLGLGKLIQSGNITNREVFIDKESLDKHIFITGVTGSGKTTTSQSILVSSNLPFLVIEPAKTEYRILKNKKGYEDLLIFSLGKDNLTPFRLNPLEFFPHESITSRVDMIKASIEAAFDMEAAIPQIIESAIYKAYEDKGWNIATNKNIFYGDKAFDSGIYSFPTLQDVLDNIEVVVEAQGFGNEAGRIKGEYIGSIKARLNGLLLGSKGFMLNTKRSIDFRALLNKKVVLEMEEIRNGAEKSLIMGFVLTNLLEAIKANFIKDKAHKLKHIILIEEAHRLLSKYEYGDSTTKKQGVEVFTDMLAEIRKYGECLIIADQIPNKLTPEVLKNTNTKIVHRIFAADDKEAISNTMALEDEQKDFLSKLNDGEAIIFSNKFQKAVATQITKNSNTTENKFIDEDKLRDEIYNFYAANAKSGIILGSQWLDKVDSNTITNLLTLQKSGILKELKEAYNKDEELTDNVAKVIARLEEYKKNFGIEFLAKYFVLTNNLSKSLDDFDMKVKGAKELLEKLFNNTISLDDFSYFRDNYKLVE